MSYNHLSGKLIVFEGVDGCGKSTQLSMTSEFLEQHGLKVHKLREPGGTALGESIRHLLLNAPDDISPIAELFLFAAARAQIIDEVVKPKLRNGYVVLADRLHYSTIAYQGANGVRCDIIQKINDMALGGLVPDITIIYRVGLDTSLSRVGKVKDKIESRSRDYYNQVIRNYELIIDTLPEVHGISADGTPHEVFQETKSVINIGG